jgi:hypothetical protein
MELKPLETLGEFENLKKGDCIIVKWSDYTVRHTPNCNRIEFYRIAENKKSQQEIICRMKGNHYFNYRMYMENNSCALEVIQVLDT